MQRKTPREVLDDLIVPLSKSNDQYVKENEPHYGVGWAQITLVINGHEYVLELRDP